MTVSYTHLDDHPRAGGELGDGEDEHDDKRHDRPGATDEHVLAPVGVILQVGFQPLERLARLQAADLAKTNDHARLRQGEAEEDADGVKRDEGGRAGAHDDHPVSYTHLDVYKRQQ